MSQNTIICMKWGTLYGPEYVNILDAMIKRNITVDYKFICFTDDPTGIHDHIETRPIPEIPLAEASPISGWRKIASLSPELGIEGTVLFLDVDLVITGNMDAFFEYEPGEFCCIENWSQKGRGIGNSSVYRYQADAHHDIFNYFCNNIEQVYQDYVSEQEYLTKMVAKTQTVKWWPDTICRSFKRHCMPKGIMRYLKKPQLPDDCRILVFHGPPKPTEAATGIYKKYIKASPWVLNHWCE